MFSASSSLLVSVVSALDIPVLTMFESFKWDRFFFRLFLVLMLGAGVLAGSLGSIVGGVSIGTPDCSEIVFTFYTIKHCSLQWHSQHWLIQRISQLLF